MTSSPREAATTTARRTPTGKVLTDAIYGSYPHPRRYRRTPQRREPPLRPLSGAPTLPWPRRRNRRTRTGDAHPPPARHPIPRVITPRHPARSDMARRGTSPVENASAPFRQRRSTGGHRGGAAATSSVRRSARTRRNTVGCRHRPCSKQTSASTSTTSNGSVGR